MHLGFEVSAALCCLAFISSFLSFLFFLLFVDALLLHRLLPISNYSSAVDAASPRSVHLSQTPSRRHNTHSWNRTAAMQH